LKCNIVFCLVFIFIFNYDLFAFLLLLFLLGKSYDECQHDNEFLETSDLMDDDNEDLFNDEARDEYDLDEGDNDYDI
jgi:hypothetical protein